MKPIEQSSDYVPLPSQPLGQFISTNVAQGIIPLGSIVHHDGKYYLKEHGGEFTELDFLKDKSGFMKGRAINALGLSSTFDVLSLPSEGEIVKNLSDGIREGEDASKERIDAIKSVAMFQIVNLNKITGTNENQANVVPELFKTRLFRDVPDGSRVIHPRRKIVMVKRGSQLMQQLANGDYFGDRLDPNTDVQYFE